MRSSETSDVPAIESGSFLEALDIPEKAVVNFRDYLNSNTQLKQDEIDSLVEDLGEYVVALPSLRLLESGEIQDPNKKYFNVDAVYIRVEEKQRLRLDLGERPVFEIEWDNPRFFVSFNALNQNIESYYGSNTPTTKSGGFSIGFIGFDSHLGTKAFVKMLNPELLKTEEENIEIKGHVNSDIAREARLLGNFHGLQETKVYIPTIYDLGSIPLKESAISLSYAAMEYIDGDVVDNIKDLSQDEILDIGITVAYVLDNLQKKYGARHLDVKPSNIMRAKDGRIVIIDWATTEGTYKSDAERSLDMFANVSGGIAIKRVVGTPEYMGPERHKYETDPKSDQHSLAVSMFRMLYGDTPKWITTRGKSTKELDFHQFRDQEMSRPPNMPINIYDVFVKATEYNPQDRYESCTEFIEALQKALAS